MSPSPRTSLPKSPRLLVVQAAGRMVRALRERVIDLPTPDQPWARPGLDRDLLVHLRRLDERRWAVPPRVQGAIGAQAGSVDAVRLVLTRWAKELE